ncbi:MAG: UDP-N-acetylmuramoyl-L-alanyl-D-glutamate--2,6-diaminopimelate ligase, partial [Candidatus Cloacimonetes bacterium]|nr:UDP-N-acetylmuramoyl-L-alanyl-D-glutamate--2,6-diaminopimelate ligase [Candidatus Cloacimonadota bacterium]
MNKIEILDILEKIIIEQKLENFTNAQKPVTDSRHLEPNDIFICIEGFEIDGHKFAKNAVEKGASLLITQRLLDLEIPQIIVNNTRLAATLLCKQYYHNPTSKFKLIGITGTNGKTTTADLFYQALQKFGYKVGLIGTLGYKINDKLFPTERTTPDIIELNEIFIKMIEAEIEYVVMEVSSHAIALNRIASLEFDAGVFTNLTQDHLDFHNTIDEYANTKFKLFDLVKQNNGLAVINVDDEYGKLLYQKEHHKKIGISFDTGDLIIDNITSNIKGSKFTLSQNNQHHHFQTSLIGKYNLFNLTATISLIQQLLPEIENDEMIKTVLDLQIVPGRLERANSKQDVGVYVDYAHSPDALENVLGALKKICQGRIICVFGAGGDRDKSKRPLMLEAASQADLNIITTDNPRSENPADIIRDIISQKEDCDDFWIIKDRKAALKTAISLAHPQDIVLIAGKGHETYQEINGTKHYFNDIEIAEAYCENNKEGLAVPIDALMLEIIFEQKVNFENLLFEYISTDTRTIKPNSIFFALNGDKFNGHHFTGTVTGPTGTISLTVGNWHHVVMVYDGSNISSYVNGQFDASIPKTGN